MQFHLQNISKTFTKVKNKQNYVIKKSVELEPNDKAKKQRMQNYKTCRKQIMKLQIILD